jgi:uncharacterized protein YndB with AHSA1/START domain
MVRSVVLASALLLVVSRPAAGEDPSPPLPVASVAWLDAPVERVWEVFTTAEGWKLLGVAHAEVDLRVGGKIRTHYEPGGTLGDPKTIESTILAFEPLRMLAFRATKAPAGFPFPPEALERTWSVVALEGVGGGRTRVLIRGFGYGEDDASQRMRAFFEQGNASTLALLARNLGGVAKTPLHPIEETAVVPGGPDEVFDAWTTEEGVRSFLGIESRIERRIGGPYELYFGPQMPEGQRGSEGCTVQAWLPGRLFAFTWNAPPKFAYARERWTQVVVELEAEAPGHTRVWLTHHGFEEASATEPGHEAEWASVRAYFAAAWPRVLQALAKR